MATKRSPEQQAEARLRRAAERCAAADAERLDAIIAARAAGLPIRRIGEAAGLSREWVRRLSNGAAA